MQRINCIYFIRGHSRPVGRLPLPTSTSFHPNFNFTARSEAMPDLLDHYGRECGHSGSCIQVINDLVLFTGNDGKLRVSRLEDSASSLFSRLPGPAVTISEPALTSSRILSLHPRVSSDGSLAVLARYRQGVALFSLQEREGPDWVRSLRSVPPSLPVSEGLASVCWTNTRRVLTVSSAGEVSVWDQTRGGRTGRHCLPGGRLRQGWETGGLHSGLPGRDQEDECLFCATKGKQGERKQKRRRVFIRPRVFPPHRQRKESHGQKEQRRIHPSQQQVFAADPRREDQEVGVSG